MSERPRISLHISEDGRVLGASIHPSRHSEAELETIATRTLEHCGTAEELLFFKRGPGVKLVTAEDLLDLRLMFREGDNPQTLVEGLQEEMAASRRVAKRPVKKALFFNLVSSEGTS